MPTKVEEARARAISEGCHCDVMHGYGCGIHADIAALESAIREEERAHIYRRHGGYCTYHEDTVRAERVRVLTELFDYDETPETLFQRGQKMLKAARAEGASEMVSATSVCPFCQGFQLCHEHRHLQARTMTWLDTLPPPIGRPKEPEPGGGRCPSCNSGRAAVLYPGCLEQTHPWHLSKERGE